MALSLNTNEFDHNLCDRRLVKVCDECLGECSDECSSCNTKTITTYFEDGYTPNMIRQYCGSNRNTILCGQQTIFYDNMTVHISGNYKCGKRHGKWTEYTKHNTIIYDGMYKDDAKHGFWIEHHECGNYNSNGKREGTWIKQRFDTIQYNEYIDGNLKSSSPIRKNHNLGSPKKVTK